MFSSGAQYFWNNVTEFMCHLCYSRKETLILFTVHNWWTQCNRDKFTCLLHIQRERGRKREYPLLLYEYKRITSTTHIQKSLIKNVDMKNSSGIWFRSRGRLLYACTHCTYIHFTLYREKGVQLWTVSPCRPVASCLYQCDAFIYARIAHSQTSSGLHNTTFSLNGNNGNIQIVTILYVCK